MKGLNTLFLTTMIIAILSSACTNKQPNNMQEDEIEQKSASDELIETDKEMVSDEEENNDTYAENKSLYEEIDIFSDDSLTTLVNRYNSLSDTYMPEDLVTVSVPTILENPEVNQLRAEANEALTNMFATAKAEGVFLFARSGFRSYETQIQLFNGYVGKHGEEAANTYSAKPGFSEHQTGLAMDVTSESVQFQLTEQFGDTPEGQWIANHAYEFGFIIRYPKGKEEITGYIYEPWHLRFLGKDIAKAVYDSGLTYEEYLMKEQVIDDVQFEKK